MADSYLEGYNATLLPTWDDSENDCGKVATAGFIVGGTFAKKGSYPFIAALGVKNPRGGDLKVVFICGGSLINRRYVVTAAHCQSDKDPIIEVLLGAHNFEKDEDEGEFQEIKVSQKETLPNVDRLLQDPKRFSNVELSKFLMPKGRAVE